MTVKEAAAARRQELKGKPLPEKLRHIMTYYWVPIVAVVLAAAAAISMLSQARSAGNTVLTVYCLNAQEMSQSGQFAARYLERNGLDPKKNEVRVLRAAYDFSGDRISLSEMQTFLTMAFAGEVDLILGDAPPMAHLAGNECFCPLDSVVENPICYDRAIQTDDLSTLTLGGPQGMTDPVPFAMILPENSPLQEEFAFPEGDVYMAIPAQSLHKEAALQFMQLCLTEGAE